MGIIDYIILAVIVGILGGSVLYIIRAKKKGKKCIGCPDSCACSSGNCGGCKGACKQQ